MHNCRTFLHFVGERLIDKAANSQRYGCVVSTLASRGDKREIVFGAHVSVMDARVHLHEAVQIDAAKFELR